MCVAADVEDTLRRLIRPKNVDTTAYSINFATTSLQTFDSAVSKATCETSVSITGENGNVVDPQTLAYEVTPDARNPQSIVVGATVADLAARLAADATDQESLLRDRNAHAADESRLVALVKPGWLMGRWVEQSQGSDACDNGPYLDFARGNVLSGPSSNGSWRLTGQTLRMTFSTGSADVSITQADEVSLEMSSSDGPLREYRRCTNADRPPATPVLDELRPDDPEEVVGNDGQPAVSYDQR